MFQAHGWCELLLTTDGEEDPNDALALVQWTEAQIEQTGLAPGLSVKGIGGSFILRCHLVQNRDNGDKQRIHDLLELLGDRAQGTYGLVYFRDDDSSEYSFDIAVMRRGQVSIDADLLLSPIIPRLEDPLG